MAGLGQIHLFFSAFLPVFPPIFLKLQDLLLLAADVAVLAILQFFATAFRVNFC